MRRPSSAISSATAGEVGRLTRQRRAAMSDRAALLRAILRTDLVSFIEKCFATLEPGKDYFDNWHIHAIAYQLERVWRGGGKRLLINNPPPPPQNNCGTIPLLPLVIGPRPRHRGGGLPPRPQPSEKAPR